MTRQSWTAIVSSALFVALAAVVALVPVPYVVWGPGATYDLLAEVGGKPAVAVEGAKTYPTNGQIRMTTLAVTPPGAWISLPEALVSYWLADRDALPRSAVYRPGTEASEIIKEESRRMAASQNDAVVAAFRHSGIEVTAWPLVTSVTTSGSAHGLLEPGDLIKAVDAQVTRNVQRVQELIAEHEIGEVVVFTVERAGVTSQVTVVTRATASAPDRPMVGISLSIGYSYAPKVVFGIDPAIGGPSAGLMFAVAIHDQLVQPELTGGRVIAGSGTLDPDGRVGPIGGVREKIAGAVRDGASVFLMAASNCADVSTAPSGIRLVPVTTLGGAIQALRQLNDPAQAAAVAGCP